MNKKSMWALVAMLFVCISLAASAATLDEIKATCESKLDVLKSASSDMTMTMSVEQMGQKMDMNASGKVYMLQEDGKEYSRSEMTIKMEIPGMGEMEQKMTSIKAGDESLALMDMMGMKMAMRNQEDDSPIGDFFGKGYLSKIEEDNTLTVLDDSTVDGQAVYVIKIEPKEASTDEMFGSQSMYISKDSGMPVKIELMNSEENKMGEIQFTNLQTNIDIDKALFDLTVPEGYNEMDPAAMMGGME